jgi:hypothetical protein
MILTRGKCGNLCNILSVVLNEAANTAFRNLSNLTQTCGSKACHEKNPDRQICAHLLFIIYIFNETNTNSNAGKIHVKPVPSVRFQNPCLAILLLLTSLWL